jgi:hypothetical protein
MTDTQQKRNQGGKCQAYSQNYVLVSRGELLANSRFISLVTSIGGPRGAANINGMRASGQPLSSS